MNCKENMNAEFRMQNSELRKEHPAVFNSQFFILNSAFCIRF
jgi:hypothetical protein